MVIEMRKLTSAGLCALLVLGSAIALMGAVEQTEGTPIPGEGTTYTVSAPFRINSNADFPGIATAGDGSAGNPWIIENYDINGTGYGYCIYIGNTTDYFVVRNCYLHEASGVFSWPYYYDTGLTLYNAQNGTIANNTVSNNWWGILLYTSSGNSVANNSVSNNTYGIFVVSSSSNTIANNIVSSYALYAIRLLYSTHNTLTNNNMTNYGLILWGDRLEHWNTHSIDTSNTVNSKPVYYWKNQTGGTVPLGAGQVVLANCTNVVVDGQNVSDGSCGIQMGFSDRNNIANNTASDNTEGILGYSSNNNIFYKNAVSDNSMGIRISYSNNNTIYDNTINSNKNNGIDISFSNNNTIHNNLASSNDDNGIDLYFSSNNTIYNNTINSNANGIYLDTSNDNTLFNNNASLNNWYGIYVASSTGNKIFHNIFIDNNQLTHIQAYDNSGINFWNMTYPTGGNYWSDYTGVDNNNGANQDIPGSDGIGDLPYNSTTGQGIQGGAGAQDNYPLMQPFNGTTPSDTTPPIISSVSVISITDISATIIWTTDEPSDSRVNYSVNSDLTSNSTFYDPTLTTSHSITLTSLTPVTRYYFEVSSTDDSGNTATDNNGTSYYSFNTKGDTTPPTSSINLISPYWRNTSPIIVEATASDTGSAVANVTMWYRFSANNATWGTWTPFGTDAAAPWEWSFSFPDGQGYYELYTVANDSAGNTEDLPSSIDAICAYDATSPAITDNSPAAGTTGDTYTFRAVVTDNLNLSAVHVIYWFGSGAETNATMIHTTANNWELGITIPLNSLDTLHYRIAAVDSAGNWNSTSVKDVIISDNDNPVADAGHDQTVNEDTLVTFDGSGSTDNIGIVNYTWNFTFNGSEILLYGAAPEFNFTIPGNYTVTLTVRDDAGNSDADALIVHVVPDTDGDGVPDVEDDDDDNDGYNDTVEVAEGTDPLDNSSIPADLDGDFIPDPTDPDTDGDGALNEDDLFPNDPAASLDTDGDGKPDDWNAGYTAGDSTTGLVLDDDDDNDGVPDAQDPAPLDPNVTGKGGLWDYWWIILIIIIAVIVALLLAMKLKGRKARESAVEKPAPLAKEESPPAEEPADDPAPPIPQPTKSRLQAEERIARLQKAYEEGKITKEMYEKNTKRGK
ncbi:MAG: NosD domain-containing protein [Candidatus Thermoplasmatota archaeon]